MLKQLKSNLTKLVLAASLSSMVACGVDNEKPREPLPLSEFDNHLTLVVCDNPQEYKQAVGDFRLHEKEYDLKVQSRPAKNDIFYTKVTVKQPDARNNDFMHIVEKSNLPRLDSLARADNWEKYDFVQYRGHDKTMVPLHNLITKQYNHLLNDNNAIWFGGCTSYDLAQKITGGNKVAIGVDGVGKTPANNERIITYIRSFEKIKNDRPDSLGWNRLSETMTKSTSYNFYFYPGKK
jgi:hypothetical protein